MRLAVKLFLAHGGSFAMGPGRLELLRTIKQMGSLRKAAQQLGMSYRWAWGRLNKAEEQFGIPLLVRTDEPIGGRPMVLTPEAEELIIWFTQAEAKLHEALKNIDSTMPPFLANIPEPPMSDNIRLVLD